MKVSLSYHWNESIVYQASTKTVECKNEDLFKLYCESKKFSKKGETYLQRKKSEFLIIQMILYFLWEFCL